MILTISRATRTRSLVVPKSLDWKKTRTTTTTRQIGVMIASNQITLQIKITPTNKPVIINLWATWCAPCVKELPSLAKLKQARPDLHVLAVSLDLEKDLPELKTFLKKYDAAALDVYSGKGPALKKALPYKGLPTTYVLSSEGKILFKIEGDTDWSSHITSEFIDYMLKIDP